MGGADLLVEAGSAQQQPADYRDSVACSPQSVTPAKAGAY
jgi:hypothetical protein